MRRRKIKTMGGRGQGCRGCCGEGCGGGATPLARAQMEEKRRLLRHAPGSIAWKAEAATVTGVGSLSPLTKTYSPVENVRHRHYRRYGYGYGYRPYGYGYGYRPYGYGYGWRY